MMCGIAKIYKYCFGMPDMKITVRFGWETSPNFSMRTGKMSLSQFRTRLWILSRLMQVAKKAGFENGFFRCSRDRT